MTTIAIIRPGSTDYDQQRRIKGNLDIPLNAEGTQQVKDTVNQLAQQGLEAIYSSPCQSAEQTAQFIAERLGVKWKTLEQLANLDHGLWQGRLIDEVKRQQPKAYRMWQEHPETVCPPSGEMVRDAQRRVQSVIDKVLKKHRKGAAGIVAPEPLASLIRGQLCQADLDDLWKAVFDDGRWESVSVEPVGSGNT